ncbi:hypothetical protein [Jatrophihabitans endophyticus]|uniref:hypothetical protein n=1 Tax=Jatrophihabitans endophyticus TaxID=1206085 RepID=UPI0019EC61DE|nr:hypothetical protein [Jatrophihabitans endophyticus]MBE7189092.1 hypothetical protein [Jatrophihabitans endophyticus]
MRARLLTRAVLVVALAVIATGAVLAVRGGLAGRDGPDTVVRRYFAALQRGEATTALSYGTVPPGSRDLVGDAALRAQDRAAPIRSLDILSTRTTGERASVQLGYVLDFPDGPSSVAADVTLHRTGDVWALDAAAVPTRFAFDAAQQRATLGGTRLPAGRALVFPGALPVRFDSPYLSGTVGNGSITFGAPATTHVQVSLTASARHTMRARLDAALGRCLTHGGRTCPQPDERYLPGSVRGHPVGGLQHVSVALTRSPLGVITVRASTAARVRYRRLDFTDRLRRGQGRVRLDLRAEAVAHAPLTIRWTR